jgi:hypothetical protein
MYKFRPSFLWHVSMLYTFSCINNNMAGKLYNTKFIITNMTEIVANDNQLHASYIVTGCKRQDF